MRPWQWLVPLTTVATIAVNGMANALPIAGRLTGEISDSFPVVVTPAGYVFAIWGVIYLGLAAYAVWQSLPAQATNRRARAIAVPVAIGNLANLVWILLWHHLWIGTSLVAMLGLPPQAWGVVTLLVATALGARMLQRYRDLAYAAVLVWAFVGIVVAQSSSVFVAATAVLGALGLVYLALTTFQRPKGAATA
ncbi:MAG: hypothetical protein K0A98_07735 [Trueperaceae bacterium]|nr:hypothetical protein [Trueperaceae bacterium]